jgi:hypothetical protein
MAFCQRHTALATILNGFAVFTYLIGNCFAAASFGNIGCNKQQSATKHLII